MSLLLSASPFNLCNPQDNILTVTSGAAHSGSNNDSALIHYLLSEALFILHHLKKLVNSSLWRFFYTWPKQMPYIHWDSTEAIDWMLYYRNTKGPIECFFLYWNNHTDLCQEFLNVLHVLHVLHLTRKSLMTLDYNSK